MQKAPKIQLLVRFFGGGVKSIPSSWVEYCLDFLIIYFFEKKTTAVSAGSGRSHHAAQLLMALACAGCAALSSTDCSISTPKETKRSNEMYHSFEKVDLLRQMIR